MGCDIHVAIEVLGPSGWEVEWAHDVYCEEDGYDWAKTWGEKRFSWEPCPDDPERRMFHRFKPGRSYDLFAMLAGVRNYEHVKPMAAPRGVPNDVSSGVERWIKRWGTDGHTHSWLTLAELMSVNFGEMEKDGWAISKHMEKYTKPGMVDLARRLIALPDRVAQERSRAASADPDGDDATRLQAALEAAYERVRMVFFFDN